jgi:hypothetical protein
MVDGILGLVFLLQFTLNGVSFHAEGKAIEFCLTRGTSQSRSPHGIMDKMVLAHQFNVERYQVPHLHGFFNPEDYSTIHKSCEEICYYDLT